MSGNKRRKERNGKQVMPTFGVWELVIILIIVVVVFGAGRLSEVGGAMGKGIREFRKATTDEHTPQPKRSNECG